MNSIFNSKYRIVTIILGVGGCLLFAIFKPINEIVPSMIWSESKTLHMITAVPQIRMLWTRPVYTFNNFSGNVCFAMNNVLYVMGSEQSSGNVKIIAIDSSSGESIWTKENLSGFTHSDDQIFLYSGRTLRSISPVDGKENWSTSLWGIRTIIRAYYYDDLIFVGGSGFPFMVVNPEDGKIKSKYSTVDGFREAYPTIPFYPASSEPFETIVINEDAVRTRGGISFSIYRSHIDPHIRRWVIENDSISNAAIIKNNLFYISSQDSIKAIDVDTGKELYETKIEPSIGILDFRNGTQHDGYYVCTDEQESILYAIFGDSRQLFALAVSE